MLFFQDAMKKPEPPKEFDEELVLAKVYRNLYDEYLKMKFKSDIWFQNIRNLSISNVYQFRLKKEQDPVVGLQESQE